MSILKVARLGHPVLRERAADVEIADIKSGRFDKLIEDMFETMHEYEGVGLAGPQVHLPFRIFVFEVGDHAAKRRKIRKVQGGVFFNAMYEIVGDEILTEWEGCLSVPFLGGELGRARSVILRGINALGEAEEVRADGFQARIFQHEIDHTDGHIYLDRMKDLTSLAYTVVL